MKGVQVEGKHNGNSERFHNQLVCCCSVTKLCPALCNPMDCSIPGFPVLHYLPEPVDCSTLGFPVLHYLPELAQT